MNIRNAYVYANSGACYQPDNQKIAKIINIVYVTPDTKNPIERLCYEIEFPKGQKDLIPISECGTEKQAYLIGTQEELLKKIS